MPTRIAPNAQPRCCGVVLLFCFFVLGAFAAPLAKLHKLNFALHFFLVLLAPIVDALTLLAREFYQSVLAHGAEHFIASEQKLQRAHSDLHGELRFWRPAFYS